MLKGEKREEEIVQNLINADIFRVEFEKYQCIAMMKFYIISKNDLYGNIQHKSFVLQHFRSEWKGLCFASHETFCYRI